MQKATNQETKQATAKERVLTTEDLVFRKVFASPQYSHILMGFINDVLDLGVTKVHVEDSYNIRTFYEENKKPKRGYTQVDVLARLGNGSLVTIEMQVRKRAWFRERALFYLNESYISNYGNHELEVSQNESSESGRKYSALRPTYGICIMVSNEFKEDNNPVHHFRMYDIENKLLYQNADGQELISMVFLELKKSSDEMKRGLKDWFDYFLNGKVATEAPEYLQEACWVAEYNNLDKEEQAMISAKEKAEQDAGAEREYIWQQGRAEIISLMLSRGKSLDEIADLTGVDKKEIERILA